MRETSKSAGSRRLGGIGAGRYAPAAMRRFGIIFGLLGAAYACGGSVGVDGSGGSAGAAGSAATGGVSGFGGSGGVGGTAGKDAGKDSGKDAKSDAGAAGTGGFVEPGCPDAAPPPPSYECDPFDPVSSCGPGEACYPWVDYPTEPCDHEQFGTICAPAGIGGQGDPCTGLCAANHVCVITGQGTQCVQLCQLVGEDNCPPGLFCVPIDVEGFGGCF